MTLKSKQGNEYHGSITQNGGQSEKTQCVRACATNRATGGGDKKKRLFTSAAPWVIDAAPHGARVNYIRAKPVGGAPLLR